MVLVSVPGKAAVVGPMAEVVFGSLQYLTLSDLKAMAHFLKYISSLEYIVYRNSEFNIEQNSELNLEMGQHLYTVNCAKCHKSNGLGTPGEYPPLFQNPIVNQDSSINLINVILLGIPPQNKYRAMPGFRQKLSDEEIANLANFVRFRFGTSLEPLVTPKMVNERR
jgi:mono/diheme cytochrome c family protein